MPAANLANTTANTNIAANTRVPVVVPVVNTEETATARMMIVGVKEAVVTIGGATIVGGTTTAGTVVAATTVVLRLPGATATISIAAVPGLRSEK